MQLESGCIAGDMQLPVEFFNINSYGKSYLSLESHGLHSMSGSHAPHSVKLLVDQLCVHPKHELFLSRGNLMQIRMKVDRKLDCEL